MAAAMAEVEMVAAVTAEAMAEAMEVAVKAGEATEAATAAEAMAEAVMAVETVGAATVAEARAEARAAVAMGVARAARRSPRQRSNAPRAYQSSHHIDNPPRMNRWLRRASHAWSTQAHRCTASHRPDLDHQTARSCTAGSSCSFD